MQRGTIVRESSKKDTEKKEMSSDWTLERTGEVYEKVAKSEVGTVRHCAGKFEEEYGLLAKSHRAGRWNGRCHLVENLPALQQLSLGGLHLLGVDGTRRQQKEAALQLVLCGVRRQVRMDSTQQNAGAARY